MLPGPTNVAEDVLEAMKYSVINHRGNEFHELYDEIQELLRYVFQTENFIALLSSSGTGGVEFAVTNFITKKDKVIACSTGEFGERLFERINAIGAETIKISKDLGDTIRASDVEEVIEKNPDATVLAIVFNETSTGACVWEIKKIMELAKSKGILTIVDSVSALGGVDIPTDKLGIDVHITGSQKCLACPPGLAFVSVSNEAIKKNKEIHNNGYFDLKAYLRFHEKKETPFTPALPLLYALKIALNKIKEEGLDNVFLRHKKCAEMFYNFANKMSLETFPKEYAKSITVITLKTPPSVKSSEIVEKMRKEHNIEIAKGFGPLSEKVIRIGCMGIINEEIVNITTKALEQTILSIE